MKTLRIAETGASTLAASIIQNNAGSGALALRKAGSSTIGQPSGAGAVNQFSIIAMPIPEFFTLALPAASSAGI